jgi:hypothetical protein
MEAFQTAIGKPSVSTSSHSVNTRYFEVTGKLRTPSTTVTERSVVLRDGRELKVLWRESGQWASTPAQLLGASLQ